MDLHEQIRQAIAASINDCIRNDSSFGSYADAATEAVMKVLEKQEPAAWIARGGYPVPLDKLEWQLWYGSEKPTLSWVNQETHPLYALPGARSQPAPNVPMAVIVDYLVSISALVARQDDAKAQAEIRELLKMLAAAPEAKP